MPYISQEDREYLDVLVDATLDDGTELGYREIIDTLADLIMDVPSGKAGGALNYTICKLACLSQEPEGGWGYTSLNEMIGHVESAAVELRRRLMDPYEDKCIAKNGDLEEFNEK